MYFTSFVGLDTSDDSAHFQHQQLDLKVSVNNQYK